MTPQESFVTRLRRQRQRCRVSLDELAATLQVKRELLEALEQNDLSAWPRGLYARAWIRAYAAAVDLDPDETVNEFCRHFPHGDRRVGGVIREMAEIVDAPPEYRDEFGHEDRRRRAPEINVLPRPTWPSALAGAGRALRLRLTSLRAGPALRARRTPRTSS